MNAVAEALLTAEEFALLPRSEKPRELVRGRVCELNVPYPRHGQVCGRICRILGRYLDQNDIGHLMTNDGGVVTETDPDTVRGPDVAYFSYDRIPRGPFPAGYLTVVPELVFEVLSPSDRWSDVLAKVNEYRAAGIDIVCVLDPVGQTVSLFSATHAGILLRATDTFTLPVLLPGFAVLVQEFFS
jgi:Uma2 family endonuclease